MILIILLSVVALYFYFRARGRLRRLRGLGPVDIGGDTDSLDERIPLGAEEYELDSGYPSSPRKGKAGYDPLSSGKPRGAVRGKGKGKAKARDSDLEDGRREVVFALGDEEEEGDDSTLRDRRE